MEKSKAEASGADDVSSLPHPKSLTYIYGCMGLWITLSVSMVLANKHILSYTTFQFPIALAFWHMAVASMLSWTAVHVFGMPNPAANDSRSSFKLHMLAIGGLFALTLCLGNAAFMLLTIPSIQMLKAGTPVAIFCIGLTMRTEKYSHMYALNILVICAGVGLASWGDYNFNLVGFVLQMGSIAVDALRCVLLQKVLQNHSVGLNSVTTLYYVAPGAMLALLMPMLLLEGPRMQDSFNALLGPMPLVVASGFLAFALNLVIFCIIGATSALTTSVTGILKEWVCILVAMHLYYVRISFVQWIGYAVALSGLACYQYIKVVNRFTTTMNLPAAAQQPSQQHASAPCKASADSNV